MREINTGNKRISGSNKSNGSRKSSGFNKISVSNAGKNSGVNEKSGINKGQALIKKAGIVNSGAAGYVGRILKTAGNNSVQRAKTSSGQEKKHHAEDGFEELDYEFMNKYFKGKSKQRYNAQNNTSDRERQNKDQYNAKTVKTGRANYAGRNHAEIRQGASKEISKSPKNKAACPYIRECGSCNILNRSYEEELTEKQKKVERFIGKYCKAEPIIGMKEPKYYRNKVHVVFDHDKKGNPVSGIYEEGTHRVIPVNRCMIHNQKADEIIASIRDMLKSFKIKTYDEDTGYGLLRHVLIKTGFSSGEIMVVLVLSSPIMPSKNNFVKALLQKHPEITTIVINVNDKSTSMVLGEKEQVIYGKGYIEDRLCGKIFRISPKSFYQVNPAQTEILYNKAIEMAELTGKETVVDAYCGIGTIGLIASGHAAKVIGVELNKDAVRDANTNAKRNEVHNIEFYNNDAGIFLSQMAEQKDIADIVFMDPPRTGSSEQFMDALALLKPKKVIYISCNPETLERDLGYLKMKGFKAVKAVPVDMFPWTGHVETVCLLERKAPV